MRNEQDQMLYVSAVWLALLSSARERREYASAPTPSPAKPSMIERIRATRSDDPAGDAHHPESPTALS
jgi:hypothetical protein